MAVIKSRKIGEDDIVERKVVAERRFGRACSELPLEGIETKSESTGKKKSEMRRRRRTSNVKSREIGED